MDEEGEVKRFWKWWKQNNDDVFMFLAVTFLVLLLVLLVGLVVGLVVAGPLGKI